MLPDRAVFSNASTDSTDLHRCERAAAARGRHKERARPGWSRPGTKAAGLANPASRAPSPPIDDRRRGSLQSGFAVGLDHELPSIHLRNLRNLWPHFDLLCVSVSGGLMADDKKSGVSRRDLLKRAGMAGAALTIPLTPIGGESAVRDGRSPGARSGCAAARAAREPHGRRERSARSDLRAADSDRRERSRRERGAGGALHRSRARRRARRVDARPIRAGLAALDRYCRSSRGKPFLELSPTRSGLGADRRRDRRAPPDSPAAPARVLHHGPHAHAAGHVRRSRTTAATPTSSAGI